MEIKIMHGDITELDVEAIVNPANSYLIMGGGLAGIIKRKGGVQIEEEARKFAPCPVGKAVVTKAGRLKCNKIIHAPTMQRPAEKITEENVRLATKAILECAEKYAIKEVAIPGLGTGVGGVDEKEAAKAMIETIKNCITEVIRRIILVGYTEELYKAFLDNL
ncbi:macro domain-containing protein [Candidatus Woesearchaeota archaeon]|nr:macro domain-containing protein [Candidatus Woesearchaeota archaeon]